MTKSIVVILKSSHIIGEPVESDIPHLIELLEKGVLKLTAKNNIKDALSKLFPAVGKIGIKPNCLAGRMMSSSPVLCQAIVKLLTDTGIDENNLIIWERSERELKLAGYKINRNGKGPKVLANDSPNVGYNNEFSSFRSVGSLLTRILTDMIDYHINFPILKDHSIAGLSGGLKNLYGAVHNPNKYHDTNCDPYAADIYSLPEIKNKNKLTIMDCFKIQYNAGPSYNRKFATDSNFILMSDDPVAIDAVALDILEDIRHKNGLPDLKKAERYPSYLETAADSNHKLGNFRRDLIDKVEIIV